LPGGFLCTIGGRLPGPEADALLKSLVHLGDSDTGRELLKTMRMTRFARVDARALEQIRKTSAAAK
jgi:hypothetical protein